MAREYFSLELSLSITLLLVTITESPRARRPPSPLEMETPELGAAAALRAPGRAPLLPALLRWRHLLRHNMPRWQVHDATSVQPAALRPQPPTQQAFALCLAVSSSLLSGLIRRGCIWARSPFCAALKHIPIT